MAQVRIAWDQRESDFFGLFSPLFSPNRPLFVSEIFCLEFFKNFQKNSHQRLCMIVLCVNLFHNVQNPSYNFDTLVNLFCIQSFKEYNLSTKKNKISVLFFEKKKQTSVLYFEKKYNWCTLWKQKQNLKFFKYWVF